MQIKSDIMTVCFGPSLESMIFTLILSILTPSLIIYFVYKRWKYKSKPFFVLFSVVVFIVLFVAISVSLYQFFTPPCGPGIMCIPFEFYPENNTCKLGNELINDSSQCNGWQERYISQSESIKKYCPPGTIVQAY